MYKSRFPAWKSAHMWRALSVLVLVAKSIPAFSFSTTKAWIGSRDGNREIRWLNNWELTLQCGREWLFVKQRLWRETQGENRAPIPTYHVGVLALCRRRSGDTEE